MLGFFCLSFLININTTYPVDSLDLSWIWALNHFNDTAYTFGKDVVFTYGPLGYWITPANYSNSYMALALNVFYIVVLVVLFVMYECMQKDQNLPRLAIFGLVCLFFCWVPRSEWAWNFTLFFVFIFVFTCRQKKKYFLSLTVLAGIMSAISLFIKFNSALLSVGMAGFLGVIMLIAYRKYFLKYFFCIFHGLSYFGRNRHNSAF